MTATRDALIQALTAPVEAYQWYGRVRITDPGALADAVLALPEIAPLLEAQAAVERVEELAAELDGLVDDGTVDEVGRIAHAWTHRRLHRALDGTPPREAQNGSGGPEHG